MSKKLKKMAAKAAFEFVEDGMKLGIGTGSTAEEFIEILAKKVAKGLDIVGVATSIRTQEKCEALNIPLSTLDDLVHLDLTIDGADEIDQNLSLIKGGGAALLREKIVAAASSKMVVISDDSKYVPVLGKFPLPIEVNEFGLKSTIQAIDDLNQRLDMPCPLVLRQDEGGPIVTDGGHLIIDASFGRIVDAKALSSGLLNIPGVVQHGLFIDMAYAAIIASNSGVDVRLPQN